MILLASLAACGSRPDKDLRPPPGNGAGSPTDLGVQKPSPSFPLQRLDTLTDGLYRLTQIQAQQDYKFPTADPTSRNIDQLTIGLREVFKSVSSTVRYDVTTTPLLRRITTTSPGGAAAANKSLGPQLKVPLTIRVRQKAVRFEQLRLFWLCVKTAGACPQDVYLSLGRSDRANVIHPALALVKGNLAPETPDESSQITAIRTWRSGAAVIIGFETAAPDSLSEPMRWRLTYRADSYERDQDRVGNPEEENLNAPDPSPAP